MNVKKIYLASDHAGFDLKRRILLYLENTKFNIIDLGTENNFKSVDYPEFGYLIAKKIKTINDLG